MRINEFTYIYGDKVVLVPYKRHHVQKYHEWMKDSELQELTASEPLTLDKEYEMQQSWLVDDDKLTFIVLDSEKFTGTKQSYEDEIESMVGDVNIFFSDEDDRQTGELEIMIAEPAYRGGGRGKEAILIMMKYGIDKLNITRYIVKIGFANERSQQMFKKLGFSELSRSEIFKEITLEFQITDDFMTQLQEKLGHFQMKCQETS